MLILLPTTGAVFVVWIASECGSDGGGDSQRSDFRIHWKERGNALDVEAFIAGPVSCPSLHFRGRFMKNKGEK